jgi:hypothetical protein
VKTSATLGFRRIVCRSCGERRIVGVTCPTCGENPDPREADPDRPGRRRLARSALEALDADLPPVDAEQPSLTPAVWTRVQAVFEDLLKSLMEAIGDQAKAPGLMRGIGAFRQLEAEVASTPRLRPCDAPSRPRLRGGLTSWFNRRRADAAFVTVGEPRCHRTFPGG